MNFTVAPPPFVLPSTADAKAAVSTYAFDAIRGEAPNSDDAFIETARIIRRAKRARGMLYSLSPRPAAKPEPRYAFGRGNDFAFTISEMRAYENNRAEILRRSMNPDCIWVGLNGSSSGAQMYRSTVNDNEMDAIHGPYFPTNKFCVLWDLEARHIERFNAWLDEYTRSFGANAARAAELYDIECHRLGMEEVDWRYVPPKSDEVRGSQDFVGWWDRDGDILPNLVFFEGAKLTASEVEHLRFHERLERTLFPAGGMSLSGVGGHVSLPPLSVRLARRKTRCILGLDIYEMHRK